MSFNDRFELLKNAFSITTFALQAIGMPKEQQIQVFKKYLPAVMFGEFIFFKTIIYLAS